MRELRNLVARLTLFPELVEKWPRAPIAAPIAPPSAPIPSDPMLSRQRRPRRLCHHRQRRPRHRPPLQRHRLAALMELPLAQAREMVVDELERAYLAHKLKQHGGNISRVADAIGASRPLVYRLMERHGIRAR